MNQQNYKSVNEKAVRILRNGGIIAYPTETVYGLGCDPMNTEACFKIQRIKKRLEDKPMLLLAYSLEQVEEMAGPLSEVTLKLARKFWPGPLTIIFNPSKSLPEHLVGSSGGVAFRVTPNTVAATLAKDFGCPIISTSANTTGHSPVITYKEAVHIFGNIVDIVVETNEKLIGEPSTIVDITEDRISIIREGKITLSHIQEAL